MFEKMLKEQILKNPANYWILVIGFCAEAIIKSSENIAEGLNNISNSIDEIRRNGVWGLRHF